MSKENENIKLVPVLRFPEFEGEWKQSVLGLVANFSKGKGVSKKDIVKDGKLSCIRYGELYTDYGEVIDEVFSKTNVPEEELVLSKGNEIIIPSSGETRIDIARASCVIREGIALGGDLNIIRSKINGVFFSYYLNGSKKSTIAKMAQGVSVMHLYNSQLENLVIETPNPFEQKKIAATLTSLDNLIGAENEKLEALQAHKKGLLQQLFPANGEKVPKLRFGEFSGEWEVLNNSMNIISGNAYNKSLYSNEGIRLIQGANVFNGFYSDKSSIHINPSDVKDQKNIIVKKGDILLGLNRPITNNELKVCQYPYEKGYLYQRAGKLELKGKLRKDFLFQFLRTPLFLQRLKTELVGSDQPYIKSNLFSTDIIIAPKEREQQKIASFLMAADELIINQKEKIEQLQQHKKGLMQQMFPNL